MHNSEYILSEADVHNSEYIIFLIEITYSRNMSCPSFAGVSTSINEVSLLIQHIAIVNSAFHDACLALFWKT